MALVTLIRPPSILPADTVKCHHGVPPLSLAYLSGALIQANHEVFCIDAIGEALSQYTAFSDNHSLLIHGKTNFEILEKIPSTTDMIGISCMFSNEWFYIKELVCSIKKQFPNIPLVLGGEHVTAEYKKILNKHNDIYACILGEGETTILELIDCYINQGDRKDISGIAYKHTDIVVTEKRRRLSPDLIPFPYWEQLPVEQYLDAGRGHGTFLKRSMPMLFSRGCPYQCTFCSNAKMWGAVWKAREPVDVIKEIKYYIQRYNINHVDFYDATAIVNRKKIEEFCNLLIESNLGISWALPSGTRSEILDKPLLSLLKRAGLARIQLAPESGAIETLNRMKKKVDLSSLNAVIKNSISVGMITRASLIFGLPGQTQYEVWKNILYAIKLAWWGLHDLVCFPFVPYCGSELYDELDQLGKLDPNIKYSDSGYESFWAYNTYNKVSKIKSYSDYIPHWQMPLLTIGLMIFFYFISFCFRPHRFFGSLYRLVKMQPETSFDTIIYGIYLSIRSKLLSILGTKKCQCSQGQ